MKKYVEIIAKFEPGGRLMPLEIVWDDGRRFEIDKILEIRKASSPKVGGAGIRYKCMIYGQERFLFLEDNCRWFVE